MKERNGNNNKPYAAMSTLELAGQLFVGPKGNFEGSTAHMAALQVAPTVKGVIRLAIYRTLCEVDEKLAARSPLDQYFNPHRKPEPDGRAREKLNDPELYRRHPLLEPDGKYIENLEKRGVRTISEVEGIFSNLTDSIHLHTIINNGSSAVSIEYDIQKRDAFETILIQTLDGDEKTVMEKSRTIFNDYAEEVAYYKGVITFLQNKPELIKDFVKLPEFSKLCQEFIETHVGAAIIDDENLATAILANFFLNKFINSNLFHNDDLSLEKNKSGDNEFNESPDDYSHLISNYLTSTIGEKPPLPTGNRTKDLFDLGCTIADMPNRNYKNGNSNNSVDLQTILDKHRDEIHRHQIEKELLKRAHEQSHGSFIIDPEDRRSLVETAIGNLVLAKAWTDRGWVFTASGRWAMETHGYFGESKQEPYPDITPAGESVSEELLINHLRSVFDGQPNVSPGQAFDEQTRKMNEVLPSLTKFLLTAKSVPKEVRLMVENITDRSEFAKMIALRFGDPSDQNVNFVNMYYKNNLSEAQLATDLRFLKDILEGFNTNLVLLTYAEIRNRGNKKEIRTHKRNVVDRVWKGIWHNDDYSTESLEIYKKALMQTLTDCENQLLKYDNRLDEKVKKNVNRLPANRRKSAEELLYEADGIKYVRHSKGRGSKDNVGMVAIKCACPKRDTTANPRSVKTW